MKGRNHKKEEGKRKVSTKDNEGIVHGSNSVNSYLIMGCQ